MSELNFKDKVVILVEFFLKPDLVQEWTDKDWSRERLAAKRLMSKYNDFEFFYSLQDLYGKFNSLFGISDKYVKGLTRRYEDFIIEKSRQQNFVLEDKPIVNIEIIKRKPKDLLEFLDN